MPHLRVATVWKTGTIILLWSFQVEMAIPGSEISWGATPVADLRFMGPNMEGHFGVLYGIAEITFTIVRTCFQTTAEKYNGTFIGKYENLKEGNPRSNGMLNT
jgi:hypothetical protein